MAGITPPQTTIASLCCRRSSEMSWGTSVLCPAACDEMPTTCTSASIACIATSSGVANNGPTSTSKPMSAKAEAMTFAPRSWPSCPILATRMRGRRPCAASNAWAAAIVASISSWLRPYSSTYAPPAKLNDGVYLPHCRSNASEISPTVHLARAASMASPIRLPPPLLSAALAESVSARSAASTRASSRSARSARSLRSCASITAWLSMVRTSTAGCADFAAGLKALTPTITSAPESIRACLRAALSSILRLGMPEATAAAMPPSASTSSITASAAASRSSVSRSIMYEPPHGSTVAWICVSFARMSCVFRASDAEKSVGSPIASSNELVWSDCVPPITAAIASTVVRMMLLYGSCSCSDQPDVWQCVLSMSDFSLFGSKCFFISLAHSLRAARSLATSM
mmetsp:Transcript_26728/g.64474  ORF Transcript_26728/g.64474 Transcript_26728/m.64474 type:complete len:400 (+) Transcript_26728:526-1725(+)